MSRTHLDSGGIEGGPRAVIRPRRNTRLGGRPTNRQPTDSSPTATNKLATAAIAILKYGHLRAEEEEEEEEAQQRCEKIAT